MFKGPICITDIETTGVSANREAITEIAIIKMDDGKIIDEFTSLINPNRSIPEYITTITGISNKDVRDAPYFEEVAEHIAHFYEHSYFMAHNVLFDFSFVKRQLELLGHSFKPQILCSVKLSRALYSDARGHSLQKIINRHGIKTQGRHRAYADAMAVYDFIKIAAKDHGQAVVAQSLNKQLRLKSLPSNFDESYLEGIGNTPGVYIFNDNAGSPVYIGKSVSLRNRILSHFNQSTKLDKEMRISQTTHSLEVIKTDSELEALLLESQLIKERMPVFNRMLRRKRLQTVLLRQPNDKGYYTIKLLDTDLAQYDNPEEIFGIYSSRSQAKKALLEAREAYRLCSRHLGLENTKSSCFNYQLGKCNGACINEESVELYNFRFNQAFEKSRIKNWKYKEPIILKVSKDKGLVIDHWIIKGVISQDTQFELETFIDKPTFDFDTYKIISRFISTHQQDIYKLNSPPRNAGSLANAIG